MPTELLNHQHKQLLDLARRKTGIRLPETLNSHVADFVRDLQARADIGFADCLDRLEHDPETLRQFIEVITIGETYFFREERQFRLIQQRILPELFAAGRPVQLWSAACATGEEAWSLAMLASEQAGGGPSAAFTVWGSDINQSSLAMCRAGRYGPGSFRTDGEGFHPLARNYLQAGPGQTMEVSPDLAGQCQFLNLNLASGIFQGLPDKLDLVMLRNVLIYLETGVREELVDAIVERLAVPGYLFLSATEVPLFAPLKANLLERDGIYFFARRSDAELQAAARHAASRSTGPLALTGNKARLFQRLRQGSQRPGTGHGAGDNPAPDRQPQPSQPVPPATMRPQAAAPATAPQAAASLPLTAAPTAAASLPDLGSLVECFELINGDGLDEARQRLARLDATHPGATADFRAVQLFLLGFADMREGLAPRAVINFTRCLELRPAYWLARYHRALLASVHNPQAASRDFQRVCTDIRSCSGPLPKDLAVFLEDFSPRYFLGICDKWLDKLGPSTPGS